MLTAVGNQHIQDSLKKNYNKLEFLLPDLDYQEGILDALQNNSPDAILVSMDIEGNLDNKAFIVALRTVHETVKVILIVKSEDKEFTNWLIPKGIFDVFIDGQCTFDEIYEALTREQKVIIKTKIQKEYVRKEKVITKEKIVKEIIPVSFRKLVLSIWGRGEFGCELSYFVAKLTNYKVLLVDLDCISPKVDIYLGLTHTIEKLARDSPKISPLNAAMRNANRNMVTIENFEPYCIKCKDLSNLFVISGIQGTNHLEQVNEKEISGLIDQSYKLFDLVILLLNPSVYDPLVSAALLKSDYLIAAFQACADNLKDFENYLLYMKTKHNLPLDRIRYAAYEYKDNVHYPVSYLKEIFSGSGFLGTIAYTKQRELYRNLNACYARWAFRKNPGEYIDILSKFNIVPKRTVSGKAKAWLERKLRPVLKALPVKRRRIDSKTITQKEAK